MSLQNKIQSHKGMTLTEVLMAVLIMTLSTALTANCIRLGTTMFEKQKRISQAQMLLDTLTVSVQDELRYATGISPDAPGEPSVFTYSSWNRAGETKCALVNDSAGETSEAESASTGRIVISGSGTNTYQLAPEGMYGSLKAQLNEAHWDGSVFTINIVIYYDTPDKPITQKVFTVVPLSPEYTGEFPTNASES